jgi:hypothetical protein
VDFATNFWLPEISSLLLAVMVLIAMAILLATTKDKEQPNWPSLLNINALLSILASIFKAAMLYPIVEVISELKWIQFAKPHPLGDMKRWNAVSKGPWGAFKLILRHPGNFLTVLGAAIIVLPLGADPFSQQVLNFYSCLKPVDGISAIIPRTKKLYCRRLQFFNNNKRSQRWWGNIYCYIQRRRPPSQQRLICCIGTLSVRKLYI